jgi:WhiB family redox-sensing transcriptional regulator
VLKLLRSMELRALVVATTEFRPQVGRRVHLWRIAPLGTVPPRRVLPQAVIERRRERDRVSKRRERARARGLDVPPGGGITVTLPRLPVPAAWVLPPGAACRGADPALFFPAPGDSDQDARAMAICAACQVRAECLAAARANGERYGIWGGVNLEIETRRACPAQAQEGSQ